MTDSTYECRDVTRSYGGVHAVHRANMHGNPGEVMVLVGPNGCGKTTLVEILLGLRTADSGEVTILGVNPRQSRRDIASRIGVTLQGGSLHAQVTPREHLEFVAALHQVGAHDVARIIDHLDLHGVVGRRFGKLSGGQQRRVMVAAALLGRPEVLVLDEPTSGVDLESRDRLWAAVRECADSFGTSVLCTTHDLHEAEENADRVSVMRAGSMCASGHPIALVEQTGLHRVVTVRGARGGLSPHPEGVTVLKAGTGSIQLGCRDDRELELVREWSADSAGKLKIEDRAPSLVDAYLLFAEGAVDMRRDEPECVEESRS